MPGSEISSQDLPNDREAWLLAAAWGSYVHAGDEGACLYGFHAGGSPPQGPAHRDACLAHLDRTLLPAAHRRRERAVGAGASGDAQAGDLRELDRLRDWLSSWSDTDLALVGHAGDTI